MKDLEEIKMGDLRGAVKALNDTGLLEEKIRVAGVKKEEIVEKFTKTIEAMEDGAELPGTVVDFYNDLYSDEADGDPDPEPEPEKEKAKSKKETKKAPAKKASPAATERRNFIAGLIKQKKFTKKDIVAQTMEKFPQFAKATISTEITDGQNEKYNRFGSLVVKSEEGILSFQK